MCALNNSFDISCQIYGTQKRWGIQRLVTGLTKNSEDCGKKQRAAMISRRGSRMFLKWSIQRREDCPHVSPDQEFCEFGKLLFVGLGRANESVVTNFLDRAI